MFARQQMSVELFAGEHRSAERVREQQYFVGALGDGAFKQIVGRLYGRERGVRIGGAFKRLAR